MAKASSSPARDYPVIDPTTYDLIVYGTGLPESLIAAAASAAGKSVLHLDPNPFYGSHFASLPPHSLSSLLRSLPTTPVSTPPSDASSCAAVDLQTRRVYSEMEISGSHPEPSGSFLLDLAGPRALYCADPAVDVMLASGASHHVEFKSVDASLLYWEGRLCPVPDSRQAIFKDQSLGLVEKSRMMRLLKLVVAHIGADGGESATAEEERAARIPAEDLEIPFAEFLRKQRLPPKIRTMILYGITLADYDQENADGSKEPMKTKEGIESLALYSSSVGRFPNAVGAFIYPIYGHGELPQAFCRCAAVNGTLYVLRMPVVALLIDKESSHYKGVRLASGQDIFSPRLVMDPSFTVPSSVSPPTNLISEGLNDTKLTRKVARGVCITSGSIHGDLLNILVVFPPRSLYSEQLTAVRALQLSSNVAVCPSGLFAVYFSSPCEDTILGKESIHAAIKALLAPPELISSEDNISTNSNEGSEGESKPTLIWSCVYVQELTQATLGAVCSCPMPDGNLDYRHLLESTMKLFTNMYPEEEYFPKTSAPDYAEEDGSSFE